MATEEQPANDGPAVAERIENVALIDEASEALAQLRASTGLSRVDIINRALKVYAFIDAEQRSGGQILIRDAKGGFSKMEVH